MPHPSLPATFRRWIRELSPTCRDMTRLQSRALDETLPWRVRLGMRLHLWLCRWCRRYGKQIRFLREALRQQAGEWTAGSDLPLPPEARARIKQLLQRPRS